MYYDCLTLQIGTQDCMAVKLGKTMDACRSGLIKHYTISKDVKASTFVLWVSVLSYIVWIDSVLVVSSLVVKWKWPGHMQSHSNIYGICCIKYRENRKPRKNLDLELQNES